MPWIRRAPMSIGIDTAAPPSARPIAKSASPSRNGATTPRRSMRLPATTIPTSEPTRNAENTRPYSSRPPRSAATIGIAVETAKASAATRVIVRTSPTVSGRRSADHSPPDGGEIPRGAGGAVAGAGAGGIAGPGSSVGEVPSGASESGLGRASGITGVWAGAGYAARGGQSGSDGLLRQRDAPVVVQIPEGVVGDFPGVPIRIDEHAVVAAPERFRAAARDGPA